MSYYIHDIPGRLRIKTPLIKRNQDMAEDAQRALRFTDGIDSISVNIVTGSIVINYDKNIISSMEIINILKERGYIDISKAITNDEYIHQAATNIGHAVVKTLFGTFIDSALESSALSFIAILV